VQAADIDSGSWAVKSVGARPARTAFALRENLDAGTGGRRGSRTRRFRCRRDDLYGGEPSPMRRSPCSKASHTCRAREPAAGQQAHRGVRFPRVASMLMTEAAELPPLHMRAMRSARPRSFGRSARTEGVREIHQRVRHEGVSGHQARGHQGRAVRPRAVLQRAATGFAVQGVPQAPRKRPRRHGRATCWDSTLPDHRGCAAC
jgi:hypothetical protein